MFNMYLNRHVFVMWFHLSCLFCPYMFLNSSSFGGSGRLCFTIVVFPEYVQLFLYCLIKPVCPNIKVKEIRLFLEIINLQNNLEYFNHRCRGTSSEYLENMLFFFFLFFLFYLFFYLKESENINIWGT